VKEHFSPHHGRAMKLGRVRHPNPPNTLKLAKYIRHAELPPAPVVCDYSGPAREILADVMLNDRLGDCVIAGRAHIRGVHTANAGAPVHMTPEEILADYSAIGGYVPGDPSTDNGCNMIAAQDFWVQRKDLWGYLAVDASNVAEARAALNIFENLYIGIELPDAWLSPFPSGPGFVWDVGRPDPMNGHCVMAVGYNERGIQICSWGMIGTLTWEAFQSLCVPTAGGECFVQLSPEQLAKGQTKAPNGFEWADIIADFDALGGSVPLPPPPTLPTPP